MRAIVGAVKYMHAHGAVHRDLKPENVCLTLALLGLGYLLGLGLNPKPKPDQVLLSDAEVTAEIRIVDLGLARFFSPEER